ncbi:MAG: hypothetical protein D3917_08020 [Candidatus Electrothrix sp. AX5]|nr:hypothetical protein [Candidatus Electrothrix sp. AX5]
MKKQYKQNVACIIMDYPLWRNDIFQPPLGEEIKKYSYRYHTPKLNPVAMRVTGLGRRFESLYPAIQ